LHKIQGSNVFMQEHDYLHKNRIIYIEPTWLCTAASNLLSFVKQQGGYF
jgi:hypothetical protein